VISAAWRLQGAPFQFRAAQAGSLR